MIQYKLVGMDNSSINRDKIREITASIGSAFPETDTSDIRGLRKTYGRNGESFHLYCGYMGPRIFLPKEHEEEIKGKLENITKLKFEKI